MDFEHDMNQNVINPRDCDPRKSFFVDNYLTDTILVLKKGKLMKIKLEGKVDINIRVYNSERLVPELLDLKYTTNFRSENSKQSLKHQDYLEYPKSRNISLMKLIMFTFIPFLIGALFTGFCCIRSARSEYQSIQKNRISAQPKLINASKRIISLNFLPDMNNLGGDEETMFETMEDEKVMDTAQFRFD